MTDAKTAGRCPFLREAQVKSCAASGVRKLVVRLADGVAPERCSSPDHQTCPAAKQYRMDVAEGSRCPFLQESLVQYCAAAPVVKYIPYSESALSRCGSGRHASCALYAAIAGAGNGRAAREESSPAASGAGEGHAAAGFPERLWYAPNHLWLDIGPGPAWRIGVDAFFAGLFDRIDAIDFPSRRGHRVPEATVVSGGAGFTLTFPRSLLITGVNLFLASNPSRLLTDPYGSGWIMRGLDSAEGENDGRPAIAEGLLGGASATAWIASEEDRLTSFVHEIRNRGERAVTMADGGRYQERLFGALDPRLRSELIARFFTCGAGREGSR